MNEIGKMIHEFTPGAAGVWTGVLMFAGWWLREWRETRKLTTADRQARREGYAKQVETMQTENREQREDLRKLREEYDRYRIQCQQETTQLRDMLLKAQNDIEGLRRKVADYSIRLIQKGGGADGSV